MENGSQNGPAKCTRIHPGSTFFATFSEYRLFTLRACPPTRLHAPSLHAPCFLAPSLPIPSKPDGPRGGPRAPRRGPWAQEVQGAKGTKGPPRAWDLGPKKRAQGPPRDPRGPGGPSGPLGKGAFGALGGRRGPMGPFGVIPRLFRMDVILREASVGVHFQRFPSE